MKQGIHRVIGVSSAVSHIRMSDPAAETIREKNEHPPEMNTNVRSIKKQFLFDLAEIYDAEHRIAIALPKMIKADTSPELKEAILAHAKEIQCHVAKVGEIFECFGRAAKGNSGKSIEELLEESDEVVAEFTDSLSSAAILIAALQKVELHEIASFCCQREWELASYGCLQEWASLLGNSDSADLLEEILAEENLAKQPSDGPELQSIPEDADADDGNSRADDKIAM